MMLFDLKGFKIRKLTRFFGADQFVHRKKTMNLGKKKPPY